MSNKKTLVLGASEKPERYSHKAIVMLLNHGHEVVAIGNRKGKVESVNFDKEKHDFENIDTVTLYLSPKWQSEYYDYIIGLNPKRVVFNPGTENPDFEKMLEAKRIEAQEACTLVLLSTGQY